MGVGGCRYKARVWRGVWVGRGVIEVGGGSREGWVGGGVGREAGGWGNRLLGGFRGNLPG